MRKPKLTANRIEGLAMLAERARPVAKARASRSDLYALPPEEAKQVRAAIKFVDELVKWKKERAK